MTAQTALFGYQRLAETIRGLEREIVAATIADDRMRQADLWGRYAQTHREAAEHGAELVELGLLAEPSGTRLAEGAALVRDVATTMSIRALASPQFAEPVRYLPAFEANPRARETLSALCLARTAGRRTDLLAGALSTLAAVAELWRMDASVLRRLATLLRTESA